MGGLAPTVTEDEFKRYFKQFGNIIDVVVMSDHISKRTKGFGFITFDYEEAVDKVVMKNFHELHEKMVEVKRALPFSPALLFSQVMFSSDVLISCVGGHMNFYFYLTDVYFLLLFVKFCYMDLVFYFGNCFFYNLHYFISIFSSFQCFSGLFHNFMLTL